MRDVNDKVLAAMRRLVVQSCRAPGQAETDPSSALRLTLAKTGRREAQKLCIYARRRASLREARLFREKPAALPLGRARRASRLTVARAPRARGQGVTGFRSGSLDATDVEQDSITLGREEE